LLLVAVVEVDIRVEAVLVVEVEVVVS